MSERPTAGRPAVPTMSDRAAIPAGLRQGDGVFETLRTYSGRPFLLDRHLDRLLRGARAIGLAPLPSLEAMRRACRAALSRSTPGPRSVEQVLRPMIYAAREGAQFRVPVEPATPLGTSAGHRGIRVGLSAYRHPGPYLVPPGSREPVKWLARGPLSHALREARALGWEEALLEDATGRLIEGTRSNLLAVVEGDLISPGPESFALPGITRAVVLEEARRRGLRVRERRIGRRELGRASEVMLTSSLMGLASVARVDGLWPGKRPFRSPIAVELRDGYADRVRAKE